MVVPRDWQRLAAIFCVAAQCHLFAGINFESNPITIGENVGAATIKILRDDPDSALTLDYRLTFDSTDASADFEATSGNVHFGADQSEATITLRPRRDGRVEGTELFDLALSSNDSTIAVATIRLTDEQIPVGRDYNFKAIENLSMIFELPDRSVLLTVEVGPTSVTRYLRRLLPNGEIQEGWGGDALGVGQVVAAHIYDDGSMLLLGTFRQLITDRFYLRLRPDGTPDWDWTIPMAAIFGFQADGKILGLNGQLAGVRYNIDGTVDESFHNFNDGALVVRSCIVLTNDSMVVLRDRFAPQPFLEMFDRDGAPMQLPQPIYSSGVLLALAGGGFAGLVSENGAENAPIGLGIFDANGNRKSFNAISGAESLARFGDGLSVSGSPVQFRGREGNLLFVNPQGAVLSSLVPIYQPPVIVRPGGKLLAYANVPGKFAGLTQFSLPNAALSEVDFAEPEILAIEGTTATMRLRRLGDTSQAATVSVQGVPAPLRFEALQNEVSFDVPTEGNPLPEWDRPIEFAVTNVTVGAGGDNALSIARILDDDGRPGAPQGDTNRWSIDLSLVPEWGGAEPLRVNAIARGANRRIYFAGRKGWMTAVLALDSDGAVDPNFAPVKKGGVFALDTQSDGKLLIAGELREMLGHGINSIGRVTPTGEFDATFRGLTASAHGVYAVAVQPDDKILVGGLLRDSNGNALVRLLKDGLEDPSFSLAPNRFEYVTRIALQADGKIVFSFARNSIDPGAVVARVNSNGSFDGSFQPQHGPVPNPFWPHALAAQPSGKILMGFGPELRRLNSDGTVDADFKLGAQPDGDISNLINLPSDKTLVAGTFKHIGGFYRGGLARLNADGAVDTSFDPGVGAEVFQAAVLPNGNYLVGGAFTSFNLQPAESLAEIVASMTPRFLMSRNGDNVETWFVADPATRVTIDRSANLKDWQLLDSRTLEIFSMKLASGFSNAPVFLRARVE